MKKKEIEIDEIVYTNETIEMCDISIITADKDERFFISDGVVVSNSTVDEVELIDWNVLQEAFSMSMTKNGHKGIDILGSTRKRISGTMNRLIQEAEGLGFKIYSWCIFDVLEKCELEVKCEDCAAFKNCEGKARNCKGYYPIKDFIKKVALLDKNTFEAQWACKKPSSEGLFYSEFDRLTHSITKKEFCEKYNITFSDIITNTEKRQNKNNKLVYGNFNSVDPYDIIPEDWPWMVAFDWGYSAPTTWLQAVYDKTNDIIYIVKEYYHKFREPVDHAHYFIGMKPDRDTPNNYVRDQELYDFSEKDYWFMDADPASPEWIVAFDKNDIIPTWNKEQKGIKLNKAINNKEFGWGEVRKRISLAGKRPRLVFFDTCVNAIDEHERLHYPENRDSEDPEPVDDHTCDVVRYICAKLSYIQMKKDQKKSGGIRIISSKK